MAKKKEGWFKPFILNPHNVNRVVQPDKPGVYVLGFMDKDRKLKIKHMRATGNVKDELMKQIGKYHIFMYKPLKYQLDAFRARHQQSLQFGF